MHAVVADLVAHRMRTIRVPSPLHLAVFKAAVVR